MVDLGASVINTSEINDADEPEPRLWPSSSLKSFNNALPHWQGRSKKSKLMWVFSEHIGFFSSACPTTTTVGTTSQLCSYQGNFLELSITVLLYPYLRTSLQRFRKTKATFVSIKRRLRDSSIQYSMTYTACLRVIHDDTTLFFTTPKEAEDWPTMPAIRWSTGGVMQHLI